jgi:hypothetical protein
MKLIRQPADEFIFAKHQILIERAYPVRCVFSDQQSGRIGAHRARKHAGEDVLHGALGTGSGTVYMNLRITRLIERSEAAIGESGVRMSVESIQ